MHAPELFDFAEIVLDEMTPLIGDLIVGNDVGSAFVGGDDGLSPARGEPISQMIGIIGLVAQESAEGQSIDEARSGCDFAALAGHKPEPHEVPKRIGQGDDLCRQSTFRAPDGLILSPPFAPLAFW